jgi:pyrroline-5-carboxylate reductase
MTSTPTIGFIGGGNMSSAILGGLLRAGMRRPEDILVVEPYEPQRAALTQQFGVRTLPAPSACLADAALVVWAVKPQVFAQAAAACQGLLGGALHLSVMAGVRIAALSAATGSPRIVRAMPNTPALVGHGMAGLLAAAAVNAQDRQLVEQLLAPTGQSLWVEREQDLDAVTALSGSGPAYFFYVVEAMIAAAVDMGLSEDQGRRLALATCGGAAALGLASSESPTVLRERVTSKGGTTWAALSSLQADGVGEAVQRAVLAAQDRARRLGDELAVLEPNAVSLPPPR